MLLKTKLQFWLALVFLLAISFPAQSQTGFGKGNPGKQSVPINTGWQFREAGKDQWHAATVPGCVHTDLLANKLIDDPFYRDNEQKQQWIGKTDWEYQTQFAVTAGTLARDNLELVFEGLDTYAEVFLNDRLILKADNMFRTWRVDVKAALKEGDNTLRVRFRSPINEVLPVMAQIKYQLPASNDQGEKTSPYTRKAPYQYGWDWGPRFVTSGIWRPVSLEVWDRARVDNVQIITTRVAADAASLNANVDVEASTGGRAVVILKNLNDRKVVAQKEVDLAKGANQVSLDFNIQHPQLWWPNGLGAHPLYGFQAQVIVDGASIDQKNTRVGIRTLELRQTPDASGKTFAFFINNVPVFAKGANWIPADSFPTRITKAKYRQLVGSARDANMNMLRVWGGGIYESDDFYEACDEMGIMLWQEFMFACSMYPANSEFLDNVRHEAVDNVIRLRNHPSIVVWCGNNEIETAWLHWGWKKDLPAGLWDDYKKIFHGVLQQVVAAYDPTRPYRPSSPSANLEEDPEAQRIGDTHYWQVWHAALPFSEYEKQRPRFMSEYGFQSFPQIETVKTYTLPNERDIQSPIMLAHQRHPRGNQLIREYMLREYPEPKDFESFLYVSQVLQAEGIRTGAEHLRRIMPRNMGSLYWQIDDCWPVASWSSIDYYGRWKALQYYARHFYANLLISPHEEDGRLKFYVVSDETKPTAATMRISVMDFNGKVMQQLDRETTIAPLASQSYFDMAPADLLKGTDAKSSFVYCELVVGGKVVSTHDHFFAPFKELRLPHPGVTYDVATAPGGFRLTVKSDKFAKAVYFTDGDSDGAFSDNYFDVIPGKPVVIDFHADAPLSLKDFRDRLSVRSMVDAF
ncbi:MAG TPA: glycoside hydrolase family 2 protein [Pyrinomonadaceae bacterium]|nr:glycoside hydrolase family 2 protein [Pyrinomonadaceae bacterium]